jgi:hypothetical protein
MDKSINIDGQWVGNLNGAHTGIVVLNLEKGSNCSGYACVKQFDINAPAYRIEVKLSVSGNSIAGTAGNPQFFDSNRQQLINFEQLKKLDANYANLVFSNDYKIKASAEGVKMQGVWEGDGENKGQFTFFRTADQVAAAPNHHFDSWKDFRNFILDYVAAHPQMVFRGQWDGHKKLRTTFHRHQRYDLVKYLNNDFQTLRHHINSISKHFYDSNRPDDSSALLGLAQHHGFPTPMLDWTLSPFVAAFFAFSPTEAANDEKGHSRYFIFNHLEWAKGVYQANHMLDPTPSIRVQVLPAHNNPRAVPQQSVMMYSSLDDIEEFVRFVEGVNKNSYLTTVELAHSMRNEALRELRLMGITSASLFPDYEGVCRELKNQLYS